MLGVLVNCSTGLGQEYDYQVLGPGGDIWQWPIEPCFGRRVEGVRQGLGLGFTALLLRNFDCVTILWECNRFQGLKV